MCKEDIIIGMEYDDSNDRYFLSINIRDTASFILDDEIAKYLCISIEYYTENLLKCNAYIDREEFFFHTTNDCKKAIRWIEDNLDYFLILRKLEGN